MKKLLFLFFNAFIIFLNKSLICMEVKYSLIPHQEESSNEVDEIKTCQELEVFAQNTKPENYKKALTCYSVKPVALMDFLQKMYGIPYQDKVSQKSLEGPMVYNAFVVEKLNEYKKRNDQKSVLEEIKLRALNELYKKEQDLKLISTSSYNNTERFLMYCSAIPIGICALSWFFIITKLLD